MDATNKPELTTPAAIGRLFDMWEVTNTHFANQGLTGEELYQATSQFLLAKLTR